LNIGCQSHRVRAAARAVCARHLWQQYRNVTRKAFIKTSLSRVFVFDTHYFLCETAQMEVAVLDRDMKFKRSDSSLDENGSGKGLL